MGDGLDGMKKTGISLDMLLQLANRARYEGDHELADGLLFYMESLLTNKIRKE